MLPAAESAWVGQLVHDAEPATFLYVPASHAVQSPSPPPYPVKPATHSQLPREVLPAADTALVGQLEHSTEAVISEYVPAGHNAHVAEPAMPLYVPIPHAAQLPPPPESSM